MADPRKRRAPRRNRPTPAAKRGNVPAAGADKTASTGEVIRQSEIETQADLLGRADGATREREVLQLQRDYGNAYVQRVVSLQRAPEAPPTSPPANKGTWLRPFPSTIPRISVTTPASRQLHTLMTGHPHIGSLPTLAGHEQALIKESNSYFESTPLQPWEKSSGEHLQQRNKLTDMFQRKAYELTLYTLELSEEQARGEQFRYDEMNTKDNPDVHQLRGAAHHLAEVQKALVALANNPVMVGTNKGRVTEIKTLDDYLTAPKLPPKTAIKDWGWVGAGQAVITKEDSEKSNDALEKLPGAMQAYKALREIYGQRFPVLMGANQDYDTLANAAPGEIAKYAYAQSREVEKNIAEARKELKPEKIWSLPIVIAQTKQLLGIDEGTGANDAIQGKLDDISLDNAFRKLCLVALQIGIQLVAAALTGGLSVAVQAAGVVVSGVAVKNEWEEYSFGKAMGARTSLDSAKRLAASEPGYGWLAFDIASMILDAVMAAAAFRHVIKSLKAADALGDATKAVKAIGAVESATGGAASSVHTMAQVEEIVWAQARVLSQEGKLAEGLTEELFVQRIMSALRRQVATQGAIAEQQASVVAKVLNGTYPDYHSLLHGGHDALLGLLTEHGEWKSLITALERGGQKQIAENLVRQRNRVIDDIATEIKGLSKEPVPAQVKPMKGGSEELVSDVDLQISGGDAGQMMIEAEAYMARRFGGNWSQMFRLNFYTEGSRLTTYHEVLSALGKGQQAALTRRMTALTERYTFARMLQHAGDDPAAVARVEGMAQGLGIDLAELRPLAAADDATRTARRYALSQEVDALNKEYRTATGARRTELGEQISAKQMEANFYTHEANIGPGSLKFSGVEGLEMQEGYQAALTQLEMIEHIVASAGGDVARAAREYELFKYIGRFSAAAEKAGKDSSKLKYLRSQAQAVTGGNRELMEETAHGYVDAGKINRGKGPTPADLPQHGGVSPPVTDDFLIRHYEMFQKEAAETLARLNPQAARRASAAPRTRSAKTTAPLTPVVDIATDPGAAKLINQSTPERYLMIDATNKRFSATGKLEEGGELSITIRTKLGSERSKFLRGEAEFDAIMLHFEGKVTGIRGAWSYGDNLAKFNELTAAGRTAQEAALGTWTGQQAVRAGFPRVTIRPSEGTVGNYTKVNVLFHR